MKKAFLTAVLLALIIMGFRSYTGRKIWLIVRTNPPAPYMVKNLDELMGCAGKAGFDIKKPVLRAMRQPEVAFMPNGTSFYPEGLAYVELNIVLLANFASYGTIAHELGHIIDYQTGRKGHSFFVGKEDMEIQALANAIKEVILNSCILPD